MVEVKIFYGSPEEVEERINAWLSTVPDGSRIEATPVVVIRGEPTMIVKEMSAVSPEPQNGSKPTIMPARSLPN